MDAPRDPARRGRSIVLLAILAATLLVYARALAGGLVYDDRLLIASNPLITDLANLPRILTSGYWDFLGLRDARYIGYWRPLTATVQALVWSLSGPAAGPYHAACIAIHLGAVVATWLLALRLGAGTWVAAATALLFALHPAHVESVAWISALNDPLFGCLALFSLERFLAWRQRGSHGIPVASLVLFTLALLAKEMAAALLPLLVLLDLLRPRTDEESPLSPAGLFRRPEAPARAWAPFALAFGLYLVARMLVFQSPWAGFDRVTTNFMVSATRLFMLRIQLLGGSLEVLAVPVELNLFRPFRPHLAWNDPELVRAALFLLVFLALVVRVLFGRSLRTGTRRLALAGLGLIPVGLLPALLRVESLGSFPLSERFLYLPALGFALGVALLLRAWFSARTATWVLVSVAALYAGRTFVRIGFWHDEETLFRRAADQSPRSVYVLWGLGRVLLERVNATGDANALGEAHRVYERAAALLEESRQPDTDLMVTSRDFLQVNLGLAWCSIYARDWSAAILVLEDLVERIEKIREDEDRARELGMRVAEQFLDLDKVYAALGVARSKSGQLESGESALRRAVELQPAAAESHQNLGRVLADQGRWEEAAEEFETCTRLRPGNSEDRLLLAQALETLGQSERAEELAHALVDELPDRVEPLVVLAAAALRRQDSGSALSWLDRATRIDPRNSLVWYQKARALIQRNDPGGAMAAFRNAVELDPGSFEAHYDCAAFLLSQGATAEARPYVVRAYLLAPPPHRPALRQFLVSQKLEDPSTLQELAQTDSARGEVEPALGWVDRLLELQPDDVRTAVLRSRLLRRLGRDEEALQELRTCAERVPDSWELWSELGVYLHSTGRITEARAALQHALDLEPPPNMPAEVRESSTKRMRELIDGTASDSEASPGAPPDAPEHP